RWWEFLSRFQYNLVYTKGSSNKIADALSRYYMNDKPDEIQPTDDYVNIDARIDHHCEYLTDLRRHEMQRGFPEAASSNIVRRSARNDRSKQDANTVSASKPGGIVDNKSARQPLRPNIRHEIADSEWHRLSAGFFWLPAPVSGNTRTCSHGYGFAWVYQRFSQGSAGM